MKAVTQNSMLCFTYNTKLCKSFEQNHRRIQRCRPQFEFESSELSPVSGKKILAKFSSLFNFLDDFSLGSVG